MGVADRPLSILVLHGMGRKSRWFAGVADVELLFPRYDREHRYVVHNCYYPRPAVLAETRFDAILLMSTFMDWVAREGLQSEWLQQYGFVRDSGAVTIAFPQDDYWYCEVRDAFYTEWGIDMVFPVCPPFSWPELLPRFLATGREARQGFTTYITEYTRSLVPRGRTWSQRDVDVVYRATRYPKAPNRYGLVKGRIGEDFVAALPRGHSLRLDISTDPRALIRGDAWYEFVGSAKAILGSNSGSSIRLRNHAVMSEVDAYRRAHPDVALQAVERAVFPPADRDKEYTAISPRNVEAASLGTVQILVPGPYSDFLTPHEHFFPLEENCQNVDEVVAGLADSARCAAMAAAARTRLLEEPALQASTLIATVSRAIRERLNAASHVDVAAVQRRYAGELSLLIARDLPGKALRAVGRRLPVVGRHFQ